jgi:hypothetical protein
VGHFMLVSVVSLAEHLVTYPTGIGLPRHRWILQMGLHMPGQVGLLCKFFAASLPGVHGHGPSKKDRMPMMILSPYILFVRGCIGSHPSSDWFISYNLID